MKECINRRPPDSEKKAKPEEGHEEEQDLARILVEDPCLDIGPPDEDRSSGAQRRGEIIAVVKAREIALHLEQRGFKDSIALRP